MDETRSTWILSGPVCLSMLANAFFLVNIVRVLVTKLKAPSASSYRGPGAPADENRAEERRVLNNSSEAPRLASPGGQHHRGHSLNGLRKAVRYESLRARKCRPHQ